jgi:hypothetical protein
MIGDSSVNHRFVILSCNGDRVSLPGEFGATRAMFTSREKASMFAKNVLSGVAALAALAVAALTLLGSATSGHAPPGL